MPLPLPIVAPLEPDFAYCDQFYGQPSLTDCNLAGDRLPYGYTAVSYEAGHGPGPGLQISQVINVGTCQISLARAGPAHWSSDIEDIIHYQIVPEEVREMAGWVIGHFVQATGLGGFVTRNISNVISYVTRPGSNLSPDSYPQSSGFYTLTVSNQRGEDIYPGNYNPEVGRAVYSGVFDEWALYRDLGVQNNPFQNELLLFGYNWDAMERGSANTWFSYVARPMEEMTYQCDSSLGHPEHIDCNKLQYSQLGYPSDTLSIQPGKDISLKSGTCGIVISALVVVVLQWEQITTAVNELIEICVNNPTSTSLGGKAFWGSQSPVSLGGSGGKWKRNITTLNALPPSVNITLSQATRRRVRSRRIAPCASRRCTDWIT